MSFEIAVENIKCGGCANTIRTRVAQMAGVSSVDVDIEAGKVTIEGNPGERQAIAQKLAQLGYPEVGSVEGMKAAAAKAKSFVSCTIGRIESAKR